MRVWSDTFADGSVLDDRLAFCRPADHDHVTFSDNCNPHIAWADLPAGTKTVAIICHDPDVPSKGDDVNQEDRPVPADMPRVDFFHWLLVEVDPAAGAIAEGAHCKGVTVRGKKGPAVAREPAGRHGANDYTSWFDGDADMGGDYFGYDGPCPPWNDSIIHHYHFTVFATDLERVPVDGPFRGAELRAALDGHILAQETLVGTFTLNPSLR